MLKLIRELSNNVKFELSKKTDQLKAVLETKDHEDLMVIVNLVAELDKKIINFNPDSISKTIEPHEIGLEDGQENADLARIGEGKFGNVYVSKLQGVPVAVKVVKEKYSQDATDEVTSLRLLNHDNIVAYRGMGMWDGKQFIVMEYVKDNLKDYIKSQCSHDGKGLSARQTWNICRQIALGMNCVHAEGITHQDLKPDNILIDTRRIEPMVKLCDFGLSCHSYREVKYQHARYYGGEKASSTEDQSKLDVRAFGLIILTCRTGAQPFDQYESSQLSGSAHKLTVEETSTGTVWKIGKILISDEIVGGKLRESIERCVNNKPRERPTFQELVDNDFKEPNPFAISDVKGEFLECGFLKHTDIYVADSIQSDDVTERPSYDAKDLVCEVLVKLNKDERKLYKFENNLEMLKKYKENEMKYEKMAEEKKIDNNKTIALKQIITHRDGDDEPHRITLKFAESNYVHHRSVRDIWRSFDEQEKNKIVDCKQDVHPEYSTSFGLHVAILTNEQNGKKKFIFTQRSNKIGMANPGAYTCGAVESCSTKDYIARSDNKRTAQVSLIETARRGLFEELGLPLTKEDALRINLNTTYLKFDNHEWGMCGFVDLSDQEISAENRFSFERLNSAFTSGPKDRFEHNCIEGVDFELPVMVEWIRKHHGQMASSAKIAAVKVLYVYFGVAAVTEAFSMFG